MRPNTGQQKQQQQQQFCAVDNSVLQQGALKNNHGLSSAYVQQGLAAPHPASQAATNPHLQTNLQQHHPQHHHHQTAGYSHHHHHHHQHQHHHQQHTQHTQHPQQPQPHPSALQHNHVVSHANMSHHPHHPPHMWGPTHVNSSCYTPQGNAAQIGNTNNNHMSPQNRGQFPPHARHFQHGPPPPSHLHATPQQQQHPHHHLHPGSGLGPYATCPPQAGDRMPLTAPNYAKLPPLTAVNQQRINECAGIPLISTASAHLTPGQRQRISRKQSHSPPGKNWSNNMATSAAPSYVAAQFAAAHAQGAPLLITKQQKPADYWPGHNYKQRSASGHPNPNPHQPPQATMQQFKQVDKIRAPLRYQNSAPAALTSSCLKTDLEPQLKATKEADNSTSSSSNAGDSSHSNETCLPRIIKPRKRRKKDRKPPNNMVNGVYMKMDSKMNMMDKTNNHTGIKSYKSSEDLLKCLQKFSQITNPNVESMKHSQINGDLKGKKDSVFGLHNSKVCQKNSANLGGARSNHGGICFCSECDPLRSIWDYPLRRSFSDSSSTSSTSGTGSLSDTNLTSELDTSTCQNQDLTAWPKTRADIVGVIGSKRVNKESYPKSKSIKSVKDRNNDAGNDLMNVYANNILGGINLSNDLFSSCSTFGKTGNNSSPTCAVADEVPLMLLPETAETLLTRSINEISQKLIETCSNEANELKISSCNSLSSYSSTSCSSSNSNSSANSSCCADFSTDSGIESAHINAGDDLVFNFDHLHIAAQATTTTLSTSSTATKLDTMSSLSSLCGNDNSSTSSSSSPTDKYNKSTNFLTSTMTATTATTTTSAAMQPQTPLSPCSNKKSTTPPPPPATATTTATAAAVVPTLESFLVDLNNNQIPKTMTTTTTTTTTTANKTFDKDMEQQQQQKFIALATLTNRQPPQQQHQQHQHQHHNHQRQQQHQHQHQHQLQRHDQQQQQFLNNCYDLMWQQQQQQQQQANQQLGNHTDQLLSSSSVIATATMNSNTAMSSFLDSVGSLKSVFSTIS